MSTKYLDLLAKNKVDIYPMMLDYLEKKTGAKPKAKSGDEGKKLVYYGAILDNFEFEITRYHKSKGYISEKFNIDDYSVGDFDFRWITNIYSNLISISPSVAEEYRVSAAGAWDTIVKERKNAAWEKYSKILDNANQMISDAEEEYRDTTDNIDNEDVGLCFLFNNLKNYNNPTM